MADIDDHPDFDLDVAISADIDGALEAYAAELDIPLDAIRTRLDAPHARARRAELVSARNALTSAPGLDELTRRRLLDGAGTGADARDDGTHEVHRRPDRAWAYRLAAAAAVVLVVVGGVVLVDRGSDDASNSAKSSAGGTSRAPATGDLGDVGSLDPAEVGRLLDGEGANALKRSAPTATSQESADAGADAAAVPGFVAGGDTRAVDTCADQYAAQGTVRFRGSGTYQGRPAVVLGIESGDRTIVFVVAADNCTEVLYSASR